MMRRRRFRRSGGRLRTRALCSFLLGYHSWPGSFNSAQGSSGSVVMPQSIVASDYASMENRSQSSVGGPSYQTAYHVDTSHCIGCGACTQVCYIGAIQIINGAARIDRQLCIGCGACSTACPQGCIQLQRN